MELHEALLQISTIRRQLARTEQFRGYRAAPVALSGLLAIGAGGLQALWIADPFQHLGLYLTLWIAVALLSLAICLGDVWWRYRNSAGMLHRETTRLAIAQFAPCLVAGALLTVVLVQSVPDAAWMLPGLWAILFSMGLFASWRLLPRTIFGVAAWYLASGLWALSQGSSLSAMTPWTMPLLFGVGQLLTAAALLPSESERHGDAA